MADPGFARGGSDKRKGGCTNYFGQFFMKTKIGPGGGVPFGSASGYYTQIFRTSLEIAHIVIRVFYKRTKRTMLTLLPMLCFHIVAISYHLPVADLGGRPRRVPP